MSVGRWRRVMPPRKMAGEGVAAGRGEVLFSADQLEAPILAVIKAKSQEVLDGLHREDSKVKGLLLCVPKAAFVMLAESLNQNLHQEFGVTPGSMVIDNETVQAIASEIPPMLGVLVEGCPAEKPAKDALARKYRLEFRKVFPDQMLFVCPPERADSYRGSESKNIFVLTPTQLPGLK